MQCPNIIDEIELEADSPKKAFYRLRMIYDDGYFYIEKESGAGGKILDKRKWLQKNREQMFKVYLRKLKQKLNPKRNSPRKYQVKL